MPFTIHIWTLVLIKAEPGKPPRADWIHIWSVDSMFTCANIQLIYLNILLFFCQSLNLNNNNLLKYHSFPPPSHIANVFITGMGNWSGYWIQWPACHDPDASNDDWRNAELANRLFWSPCASQRKMLWTPDCGKGMNFLHVNQWIFNFNC